MTDFYGDRGDNDSLWLTGACSGDFHAAAGYLLRVARESALVSVGAIRAIRVGMAWERIFWHPELELRLITNSPLVAILKINPDDHSREASLVVNSVRVLLDGVEHTNPLRDITIPDWNAWVSRVSLELFEAVVEMQRWDELSPLQKGEVTQLGHRVCAVWTNGWRTPIGIIPPISRPADNQMYYPQYVLRGADCGTPWALATLQRFSQQFRTSFLWRFRRGATITLSGYQARRESGAYSIMMELNVASLELRVHLAFGSRSTGESYATFNRRGDYFDLDDRVIIPDPRFWEKSVAALIRDRVPGAVIRPIRFQLQELGDLVEASTAAAAAQIGR